MSENQKGSQDIQKGHEEKDLTSVHIGIPILAVVLILAAGLLLMKTLRNKKVKQNPSTYIFVHYKCNHLYNVSTSSLIILKFC